MRIHTIHMGFQVLQPMQTSSATNSQTLLMSFIDIASWQLLTIFIDFEVGLGTHF